MAKKLSGGVAHAVPTDLKKALSASSRARATWEDISPLARNEWICWTITVKTPKIRKDHVRRVVSELQEGIRRPCCWAGCIHRTDKKMSVAQKWVTSRQSKKK